MAPLFLAIQGSYTGTSIALFKGSSIIDQLLEPLNKASSMLIPSIQTLLTKHAYTVEDLNFIAVDQGPGAFTSLRVTISTVNSLSFAMNAGDNNNEPKKKLSLVGIDGLDALAYEIQQAYGHHSDESSVVCAFLNAFNNEVYCGFYSSKLEPIMPKGYKKADQLLQDLLVWSQPVRFVAGGNGLKIVEASGSGVKNLCLESLLIDVASVHTIGALAYQKYMSHPDEHCTKLMPLYMKTQNFSIKV